MKNLRLHIACYVMIAVVYHFSLTSALATDYRNSSQVKQLIEQTMRQPQFGPEAVYYSCCISHFDGFIPHDAGMTESYDQKKPHYKYTYHDGRITKCEFFDEAGKLSDYCAVWNNSVGAPVLSGDFREDGTGNWYMYAEYDTSGKIHILYRFNASFELERYEEFSYEGSTTRIKTFGRDSKPGSETLYENGEVFVIKNGEKRKVSNGNRDQGIRSLVKFGLKPLYPGY